MTGRDLIVYILKNNLENEEVFKDGVFLGFLNEKGVAVKFKVGIETVKVWRQYGLIKGIQVGDSIFFPGDLKDPRKE